MDTLYYCNLECRNTAVWMFSLCWNISVGIASYETATLRYSMISKIPKSWRQIPWSPSHMKFSYGSRNKVPTQVWKYISRIFPDFTFPNDVPRSNAGTMIVKTIKVKLLSILNKVLPKCMLKNQVWKIIFFFHINRPNIFSILFHAGKWQNIFRFRRNLAQTTACGARVPFRPPFSPNSPFASMLPRTGGLGVPKLCPKIDYFFSYDFDASKQFARWEIL